MLDESDEQQSNTANALALGIGFLLLASVVIGSGALGQTGEDALTGADGDEHNGESEDGDPAAGLAADGVEMSDFSWEDCFDNTPDWDAEQPRFGLPGGDDRTTVTDANGVMTIMQQRQTVDDSDHAEGDETDQHDNPNIIDRPMPFDHATGTAAGFPVTDILATDDPCAGMWDERGQNWGFGIDFDLNSMFSGMCEAWVHSEFWNNIGGEVTRDENGVTITTIDDDGIEVSETISERTAHALTAGLAPLVDSCTTMLTALTMNSGMGMGNGMPGMGHGGGMDHDWGNDWDDHDDWQDWDNNWDDCESDWNEEGDWLPAHCTDDWHDEDEWFIVELWIATDDEGHGYWITFETYECAGVHDFIDDSGNVHTLEYDVCEDEEEFSGEEWYDEEENTLNSHWQDDEGTYWLVFDFDTCTAVYEWVDADGESGREEWTVDDCGEYGDSDNDSDADEEESDENECEHYNDSGECMDDDSDEEDESDDNTDPNGNGGTDSSGSDGHGNSDDSSDDESDDSGDADGNNGTPGNANGH